MGILARSDVEQRRPLPHDAEVLQVENSLRVPVGAGLRENVRALLRRGRRKIVLNLAAVSTLDAAGIGELVRVYNMTLAAHGMLRLTQVPRRARTLLDRVGLFDLLNR